MPYQPLTISVKPTTDGVVHPLGVRDHIDLATLSRGDHRVRRAEINTPLPSWRCRSRPCRNHEGQRPRTRHQIALQRTAARKRHDRSRLPPHSKHAALRAAGLEAAALIDNAPILVTPLDSRDGRAYTADVAGTAALLVAKLHKIGERQSTPGRLVDMDAPDLYRLLAATRTENLAHTLRQLQDDPIPGPTTHQALTYLADLFAAGPDAVGAMMAGRAEQGIGDPITVATSAAILASDLLDALQTS